MRIVFFLFVIFIPACSSKNIQTSEFIKEPQSYNIPTAHSFSYPRDKNETITYIINQFSNSSLQFEKPKNSLDFLTINYSPDQPEKFIDCGMTTITDMNNSKTLSKQTFINTKYSYTYNKYRRNHIDTYAIRNKLLISANIITSGNKNNSNTVVQMIFNLKVRKLISSTQGAFKREQKKFKLQLALGERKLFEAYGTKCTSTGLFEKMIEDALLPSSI